jgi:hypothetical protein
MLTIEKRGTMKDYLWSELALIFIPAGETKTIAEMSYHEYTNWHKSASKRYGYEIQFVNWLLRR